MNPFDDTYFMKKAIEQAQIANDEDEVPIGAVIVSNGRIIAKSHNQVEKLNDTTAHCEILAITSASNHLGAKYLKDCTIYVTVEPCIMCAGALKWAQIGRIVYSTPDEKNGFMKYGKEILHRSTKLEYGLLQNKSEELMKTFFKKKR